MGNIEITPALKESWQSFRRHWKFFVTYAIFVVALSILNNLLQDNRKLEGFPTFDPASFVSFRSGGSLLLNLFQMYLGIGFIKVALKVTDGGTPQLRDFWSIDFMTFLRLDCGAPGNDSGECSFYLRGVPADVSCF